ncbi:DUF5801 repeats-in-toxin domain-containing protein [Mesorhizobium sp. LjNodule214]|uniref:DUF5801 repeats-in-toxin domain-containing protein n=1 Tax=Mesorhizobium sp. LjNodule214 TaxID=3342252 RepID=UPI003ECF9D5D
MALDILTQDIIIDETTGLQDDDVNPLDPPHLTDPTLLYLLSLDDAGGLTSPEVAFQTDFVQATASAGETITSVVLAQNATGTPFSTTVGVNSGIQTVDGNYVWLFQDPTDANVVIGVIGTSDPAAEPAETGPLAYSFALISTSATNADLYTVQYVPLLHPNAANADDQIDLTNKVFTSVTGTSVTNFAGSAAAPGNHDFYLINSAADASKQLLVIGLNGGTANVSTQGFGINNQSINPNETLQVDFVTGGTLAAGDAAEIQYGSHIETITQAGFTINQITPSSPTDRVDVSIAAFNNTGNEQGSDFFDGTATSSVNITSVKLTGTSGFASIITTNGTYATGSGNVTVSGLGTGIVTITELDNVTTVDITTSSPMDRLQVSSVDSNEGLDITEFHFTGQTTNAHNEEVGSFINFDDDGPSVTAEGTVPTLTTDDTEIPDTASTDFSTIFSAAFGADGFKDADDDDVQDADAITYALGVKSAGVDSGLDDTISGDNILLRLNASGEVEGYLENATTTIAFLISVDANTGAVTLAQNRSIVHDNATDPVESGGSAAALAAADLVTLTATATDGDGDTDDATANIGTAFTFEDDGPSVTAEGTVPTLTTDDTDIPDTASTDFSTIFSAAFGTDGFKDADDDDVQDTDAITYALGVKSDGVDSGLDDTISGDDILLRLNASGEVEGYLANATATVAFLISVDATGAVTLAQNRSVVHDDASDPVETGGSAAALAAADLVTLTATATDGDGDTADATADIGDAFTFEDDGPSVTAEGTVPTLTTDDTDIPDTASTDFSTIFSAAFGTDGFKDADDDDVQDADAITYALGVKSAGVDSGLDDTISGDDILLRLNASGEVEGYLANATATVAFLISVDATGAVTLTQNRSVVHDDASDPVETGGSAAALAAADLVTLTATATDGDGDTADATADIGDAFTFEDDGPSVTAEGTVPTLTTDDTDIPDTASTDFSTIFSAAFGTDGFKDADDDDVQDADAITYALGVKSAGVDSGLDDTISGDDILLRLNASGEVEGYLANATATVAFLISVDATGAVTLTQNRSVVHDDASDPVESGASAAALAAADLVTLTATATDGDGDTADATANIGDAFTFEDDGPSIVADGTKPTLTVDESDFGTDASASFAGTFTSDPGADGAASSGTITYALSAVAGPSGLIDSVTGEVVNLVVNGSVVEGRNASNLLMFTISVAADGTVTLDQARAVTHSPDSGPDEQITLASDDLVTLTATITDGDGDQASDSADIGKSLVFKDDAPTIPVPFDGDQDAGNGSGTPETLANTPGASATGAFGYNLGSDAHTAAFYTAGGSDFVDQNLALAGVQIGLSGTIVGGGGGNILTPEVTLASEDPTSATFNFSFTYDKDPAAGLQAGTAGGTLVFDKAADTYTITLTDPLEGFSFDFIHTSELLSKEPTSNSGHPQIVLEKLQADDVNTPDDEDFYVQFTSNSLNNKNKTFSLTNDGEGSSSDTTFNSLPTPGTHDMVSNNFEDWVSATQTTNGVAGDTIQKGELLTLRFFNNNVGIASEATTPTATAGNMAIKFDGIGNREDLMLILDLIDKNGADNIAGTADDNATITRAVYVSNDDIFKKGQVPDPYASEFPLDNNDGLVIIEQNDYNAAGEDYLLRGVQIMQSGNGITGDNTAIDLNRTTGAGGGSNATTSLVNFDGADNDVLKITDIGFTTTVTETPEAHLDFAFQVEDSDADQTAVQHILVDVA